MTRSGRRIVEWLALGGMTLTLLPLSFVLRSVVPLDAAELAVGFAMFHLAHVLNDPHFSVTYLLFYRDIPRRAWKQETAPIQRLRWWLAGVVAPCALAGWAGWALYVGSGQLLGWMAQLMYLLVGWHYAKQGFGVLTVFCARRGVRFAGLERRVILAHCYAAWAFAWANPAKPAGLFEEKGVVFWAPPRPEVFEWGAGIALLATSVALVAVLVSRGRRGALPIVPMTYFLVTIWLWTIATNVDPLLRYMIPALHSIQYLYVVALLDLRVGRDSEGPPHFGLPAPTRLALLGVSALALGYAIFRAIPAFLDDARGEHESLGSTPHFAAFFIAVNLHHYFMDWVIWRRDDPALKLLMRADSSDAGGDQPIHTLLANQELLQSETSELA